MPIPEDLRKAYTEKLVRASALAKKTGSPVRVDLATPFGIRGVDVRPNRQEFVDIPSAVERAFNTQDFLDVLGKEVDLSLPGNPLLGRVSDFLKEPGIRNRAIAHCISLIAPRSTEATPIPGHRFGVDKKDIALFYLGSDCDYEYEKEKGVCDLGTSPHRELARTIVRVDRIRRSERSRINPQKYGDNQPYSRDLLEKAIKKAHRRGLPSTVVWEHVERKHAPTAR